MSGYDSKYHGLTTGLNGNGGGTAVDPEMFGETKFKNRTMKYLVIASMIALLSNLNICYDIKDNTHMMDLFM